MKNTLYPSLTIIILSFASLVCQATPTVTGLKCENLINPNAIDNVTPHFSWKILNGGTSMTQLFYEIQVASDSLELVGGNADLWNTGKTESSSSVMVSYLGEELSSRSLCYWRVRVWNDKDEVSDWSDIARFGVGILNREELHGKFIGLPASGTNEGNARCPLLRKTFTVNEITTSFLHINTLGYHEAYINGKKVGDDVLSPAVSQLNKRTITVTYDVTSYLKEGENDLVLWLGTGWYKNQHAFKPVYDGALVNAQLDALSNGEWQTVVSTDASWQGRGTGYTDTGTWQALQFGGERIDARYMPANLMPETLDQLNWFPVTEYDIPADIMISPEMTQPNKIREVIKPQSITRLKYGVWLVDMGKNLNGWFEIKLPELTLGHNVIMEYTDHIDKDGVFQNQSQRDVHISSGNGAGLFRNKFNHHAFRYVRITNLVQEPLAEDITAYHIYSDYRVASSFECSDADLNAIHDMIQYTMQCLTFSGYMVDCPHLERAGYGGDGNSSTMALQTMYDVSPVFYNWVLAWFDSMREDGGLPHVAPNMGAGGGGPYWCGFIIMAPWRTYVNYNDARLIEKYYPDMKQWLGYVEKYTVDGLLKRWPDTDYRDWFLGDWLAPNGTDVSSESTVNLVNNCFVSECFATMEKIANVLGKPGDALEFKQKKEQLNQKIHSSFYKSSSKTYSTGSQLDMTYPMLVGATPDNLYEDVKTQLFERTQRYQSGHIGGGLVGVPIITEWAVRNNAVDYIYTMLKKRSYPSYLYMIDNGATTTWEYWNGERSRIHNCYNGIGTWFYQAVGGIRPDEDNAGYKHFYIEPQIPAGVTWAKTTKESPFGTIAVDWNLESSDTETLYINASLPVGTTATVILPGNTISYTLNGEQGEDDVTSVTIESGVSNLVINLTKSTVNIQSKKNVMSVYPNPFNDFIMIDSATDTQAVIYNLFGQPVLSRHVSIGSNKINTSTLPQGTYLLKYGDSSVKVVK